MRIRWTFPAANDLDGIKNYLQELFPHFAEPTVRTIYSVKDDVLEILHIYHGAQDSQTRANRGVDVFQMSCSKSAPPYWTL